MICFVRRSTIDFDIRLSKYIQACVEREIPFIAITWDRMCNSNSFNENEFQYKRKAPYGGGWKGLFQFIGWLFFVYAHLLSRFSFYKVIHACNLESLLVVLPFKLLGKKIVFDIYDTMSPPIERRLIPFVDMLILPNINRLKQEGLDEKIGRASCRERV